ncbi:dihydrodipicolinate synthase family protein [Niabella aurantiaca]|uniref:dihydrodipicolinate synthase family protein n=1 Tax=Niabella aurantiaca TaxID=379900 RepID=UPI000366E9B9|nr:dihydrodipicolinate synthase family protein [Niabella aurantiaca]
MKSQKLEGVIIAMPTPLLENEDIDIQSLHGLIDYCVDEGANGIMLAGTMGEGPAMIDSQKYLLIEAAMEHTKGRVPILATVPCASTRRCLKDVEVANQAKVDYIVCTSPFYYKYPDPQSLIDHLTRIAENTDVPMIFYNASGFTNNPVDVDTMETILNMEKVRGVKDSSANFTNFVELLRRYPDRSDRPGCIMQGDESVFDISLLMGADGVVSGGGITSIKLLLELYSAGSAGDKGRAIECQRLFYRHLSELLMPNPQRNWMFNIKKKLSSMGVIPNAFATAPFMMNS